MYTTTFNATQKSSWSLNTTPVGKKKKEITDTQTAGDAQTNPTDNSGKSLAKSNLQTTKQYKNRKRYMDIHKNKHKEMNCTRQLSHLMPPGGGNESCKMNLLIHSFGPGAHTFLV